MKRFILLTCFLLSLSVSGMEKPNVILILIDDMGWKDLGCTGSTYYETPNIDRLAASGVIFENAYSSSPVCAPSRGAILTGKNPARTKFTTVVGKSAHTEELQEKSKFRGEGNQVFEALHRHLLPISEVLVAKPFSEAGYKTGYFGKWHCGVAEGYFPDDRGFEVAAGYRTGHVATKTSGHWMKTFGKYAANLEGVSGDAYVADVLTDKSLEFIDENKTKPFLLMLSHYLVHDPMQAKEEKVKKYEAKPTTDQDSATFAAMVESVDESVGRILDKLEEQGLRDNTLIVFTSDNGGQKNTSTYPLLGMKSTPYLGGHRVPLIMSQPGLIQEGTRIQDDVIGMDLYPTMLNVAGLKLMPEQHKDGVSLLPLLHGESIKSRPLVFHFPHYTSRTGPYSSIIMNGWHLIRFYNDESGAYQLFNIQEDESQQVDLSKSSPEMLKRLGTLLDESLQEMSAEMPIKNESYQPGGSKNMDLKKAYSIAMKAYTSRKKALDSQ